MALLMTCPPCAEGRCEDHIPHSGPDGLIGGVSCPCSHTAEEQRERRRRREEAMRGMFEEATDGEVDTEDVYIGAAKRLGVESGALRDWYVGTSPRNGMGALAEGMWCHWVNLARLILAHDLTKERMPEFHVEYDSPGIYSGHHPACKHEEAADG